MAAAGVSALANREIRGPDLGMALSSTLAQVLPVQLSHVLGLGCGPDYGLLDAPGGRTKSKPCAGWTCDKTDIDVWSAQSAAAHSMVIAEWNRLMSAENDVQNWEFTELLKDGVDEYFKTYGELPVAGFFDRLGGSDSAVAQHIASIELARCRIHELKQAVAKVKPNAGGGGGGGAGDKSGIWRGWYWIGGLGLVATGVTTYFVAKPDAFNRLMR